MWELKGPGLKIMKMRAKDSRTLRLLRASGYRHVRVNGGKWKTLKQAISEAEQEG